MNNIIYLLFYAWKKSKLLFLTTSLKYIFTGGLPLIGIVGIGSIVESLDKAESIEETVGKIVIYLSISLGISIAKILITFCDNVIMRRASDITQMDYMRDCILINYHFVEDRSILNLKKKSMGANPVWFLDKLFKLLLYVVQFAGIAYLFITLSPWFILLIVLTSTITIAIDFAKKKNDYAYETAQAESNRKIDYVYNAMSDYKYAKDVRINEANGFLLRKYDKFVQAFFSRFKKDSTKKLCLDSVVSVIAVMQTIIMYIFFSWQVTESRITIAEYTMLLGATTLLISIIIGFFGCLGNIRKTLAYTDLFRGYQDAIRSNSTIDRYGATTGPEIDWKHVEIRFSHVSFSYPNRDEKVLDDIDFVIRSGEHIAIFGLNGAGKTTIVKLLLRLYDPTIGMICVNGVDIRDIPHGEYVRHIGTVLQDFCIFAYSVKENLTFDEELDEERSRDAFMKSGFDETLRKLEKGMDTSLYKTLDDSGVELSGGEGQRLSIARAVYKNSDILIFDEPTSMLDPIAENSLFERMANISDGKSTVIISHRLSSAIICDKILILSRGKIIEEGSHEELINSGGVYAKMFRSHAKYYENGECKDEN